MYGFTSGLNILHFGLKYPILLVIAVIFLVYRVVTLYGGW